MTSNSASSIRPGTEIDRIRASAARSARRAGMSPRTISAAPDEPMSVASAVDMSLTICLLSRLAGNLVPPGTLVPDWDARILAGWYAHVLISERPRHWHDRDARQRRSRYRSPRSPAAAPARPHREELDSHRYVEQLEPDEPS
jgi:hypothetical protein